jgi:hypothetical protein
METNTFSSESNLVNKISELTNAKIKKPNSQTIRVEYIKDRNELFNGIIEAIKSGVSKAALVNVLNNENICIDNKTLKFEVRDITKLLEGVKGIRKQTRKK